MEASGLALWFERLLGEMNIELWTGDAAVMRAKRGRKPNTDRQDALHILHLMFKDDFPQIWVPTLGEPGPAPAAVAPAPDGASAHASDEPVESGSSERRTTLQEEAVERARTRTTGSLSLSPWASRRRKHLLRLLDGLNPTIAELTQAIEQAAEKCPQAQRSMMHPVGGCHLFWLQRSKLRRGFTRLAARISTIRPSHNQKAGLPPQVSPAQWAQFFPSHFASHCRANCEVCKLHEGGNAWPKDGLEILTAAN